MPGTRRDSRVNSSAGHPGPVTSCRGQPDADMLANKLQLLELEEIRLRARLLQLREERMQIHAALVDVRLCIESLPPELLLKIFSFSIHDNSDTSDDPELMLRRDLHAVAISHVSRRWRQLALSSSGLWTYLVLNKMSSAVAFMQRSRQQPVDLIHVSMPLPRCAFHSDVHQVLLDTAVRWRTVFWESSEDRARHILSILNRDNCFSNLRTLDIRVDVRESPCVPIIVHRFTSARFPALTQLYLSGVSPSEIPPSAAHSLRLLSVNFPLVTPPFASLRLPPLLRMSTFCSFLTQASRLETLIISECTPVMDVYLHPNGGHHAPLTSFGISAIHASLPCSAVRLPRLRKLEWTLAPPKDLWRLFHFLDVPNLQQLDIWLGKADERWPAVGNAEIGPMSSSYPLSLHPVNELVTCGSVRELRLFCSDVEGLPLIRSKIQFPALETLELSHVGPLFIRLAARNAAPTPSLELPTLESVFRDPRLVKLTHLTISGFVLRLAQVTSMLSYIPELQELLIDSCEGTCGCKLLKSTNGESNCMCGDIRWMCPHLERMVIKHSSKLSFWWLRALLDARQRSTKRSTALQQRAVRPLPQKRHVQDASSPPCTPRKPNAGHHTIDFSPYATVSSPNGSFVAGWNPHEHTHPLKMLGLVIEDCRCISAAEVTSLEDGTYGSVDTVWIS